MFLLQVDNKADTHVLWFSVRKKSKKSFLVFVLINSMTSLGFEKILSYLSKNVFGIFEEKIQKRAFHFVTFSE